MNKLAIFVAFIVLALAMIIAPVAAQERRGGICREGGRDLHCPTYRAWREFGFYEYRAYDSNQYSVGAVVVRPADGRGGVPHRALDFAFELLVDYVRGNNSANATVGAEFPSSVEWFTFNHTLEVYVTQLWLNVNSQPPAPNDNRLFLLRTTEDSTYFAQSFSYAALPTDEEVWRAARNFQLELLFSDDLFISNMHTVSFYDRITERAPFTKEIAYYALPIHADNAIELHNPLASINARAVEKRAPEEYLKMAMKM